MASAPAAASAAAAPQDSGSTTVAKTQPVAEAAPPADAGGVAAEAGANPTATTAAIDSSTPMHLRGNGRPVTEERTVTDLKVTGSIPPSLSNSARARSRRITTVCMIGKIRVRRK